MAKITIDKDRCKGCLLCINFCPKALISKSNKLNKCGMHYVEFSRRLNLKEGAVASKARKDDLECSGCCMCAIICPDCCIEVYK